MQINDVQLWRMNDNPCIYQLILIMKPITTTMIPMILILVMIVCVRGWCEKTRFAETKTLNEIDISPDRTMVITSSSSKMMIIWNFTTFQPIFTLTLSNTVMSSKFSKNQQFIAVGQTSNSIRILNGATFASVINLTSTITSVKEVDFSWDSTRLLVCGTNAFQIWLTASWTKEVTTPFGNGVTTCKFQKNSNYFIGDSNGKNNVYTTGTNALLWTDNSQGSSNIISSDFDMVGWTVISGNGGGNKILIYPSAKCGACSGTTQSAPVVKNLGSSVNSVAFAKDGSTYAIGTNGFLMIYENNTNNVLFNFTSSSSLLSGVFSYDSQYYICGSNSGIARVFKRFCQDCPAGTYEFSSACIPCTSTMIGCLNCANSSFCYACGDGYALDTTNNNCTLCQNTMNGCILCNSTTICTACSSVYYLLGNACTSCIVALPNCLTCVNSTACTRCNSDFYLDSSTLKCLPCGANNCLSCYNSTYCLNCASGFYLSTTNFTCIRCIQNCTSCYNASKCIQCMESFYLNSSGVCTGCPTGCLVCTASNCTRCVIGYYSNGTGCSLCGGACYVCANASYCYGCVSGYYQSSGSCLVCSGMCLTCTSPTSCLSCNINYYLTSSNTCAKCQNLVGGCLQCTNTTCLRCQSGNYLNGTSCLKCSPSYGCQTCSSFTYCLSCLSGYQLNVSTGVCTLCGVGCSSCANSSVCINCLPKYYLSSGVCYLCPAGCPTCFNTTYCISCLGGYYMNSSQICASCNSSIGNCASCYSSAYCTSCNLGYYLTSANTSCIKCTWPCSLCNASQCNQCSTGYYLSSGSCYICPLNCASCFSSAICNNCVDGFYLSATNSCISCQGVSLGCTACNQSICFGCLSNLGYYLANNGSCGRCSFIANCLICQNSSLCTICSSGYYINSGVCQPCSAFTSNCQSCNVSACLRCMDPYFLSGSTCQLCSEGCSICSSAAICKNCSTGYLLQNNTCTYCDTLINGCQVCTSATVCTLCAEGYIISGTTCVSCYSLIPGCQYCNGTSVCLACMDQYYLSGSNSCVKCSTIPGCSQCNSSSICLTCQSGYFQNSSNSCSRCSDVMCTTCTNSTNCVSCLSGYYSNSSGNCRSCNAQFAGCVMCTSTACLQCQSGYFVNSTNQCSRCLLNGCEVCNSQLSTSCVTCSSLYYLTSSNTCVSCSLSMTGCISCLSATQCLKCMVGSYLAANNTCQLCFSLFKGCGECSATGCTVCQGGYTMNATTCTTCIAFIPGCLYCTSQTVCLSCQSGYYQSGSTCLSCSGIAGCLDCSGASFCNLCSDSYYLNTTDHLCYLCNSTLNGCIACSSSGVCKACIGNYALSGGACSALKAVSTQPYTELRLVTEYVSTDQLKHRLIVSGSYNTQTALNLTLSSTITMVSNSATVTLTIYSYYWVGDFELVFITNNPLGTDFNSLFRKMPATNRLLQENESQEKNRLLSSNVDLNYEFKLDMTETAIQSILPSSDHMGSLSLSNPADNPSFIRSIYSQVTYNYHYFGLILTLLMLVIYFVKAAVSVPQSDDHGELMSHIFVLRCGGVIFSLAYVQYMDYCFGFLTPDLPWLNNLTAFLAASSDLSPNSYLLFYPNMTIASSYFSALCLILLIIIVLVTIYIVAPDRRESLKTITIFFYNFFEVGLIMAGSMSIQGAYYNNLNYFTSNSFFYMGGILMFVAVGVINFWMTAHSLHRINKIRILVKTTFLSLLYVSPIYLLPIAIGGDAIFVFAEYHIKKAAKLHPHLWVVNQVLVNMALVSLVLLSQSLLSLLIPSILVSIAVLLDLFIHIRQFKHQEQLVKVKEIQKLTTLMETQEKLNKNIKKRNNNIYQTTKMTDSAFGSSQFGQDIVFNGFEEDISSSNSPFQSSAKKQASAYHTEDSHMFKQI